jgi:hypothetical protein
MALACGKVLKVTLMSVSGNLGKQMDSGLIHGSMETDMKASLRNVLSMVKDYKSLPMETFIRGLTLMENLQDTENTIG